MKAISTPIPVTLMGIDALKYNPYDPHGQYVQNSWHGQANGKHLAVYAGSYREDEMQGVIGVAIGTVGERPDAYTEYRTSHKRGYLKITVVNGSVMSLVVRDGTMLTFDLSTFTFSE